MNDFLTDLDAFFCEKYANYDKLCILPGYKVPMMQASEVREDGRTYAYTLPMDTMRLSKQAKKTEILAELKSRLTDKTFSFSFQPYNFSDRLRNKFSKYAFHKNLKTVLEKYRLSPTLTIKPADFFSILSTKAFNSVLTPRAKTA